MATIQLDTERSLKWTMRAEFKLGRLPNPPSIGDIGSKNRRKAFYALCCHLWASLEGEHPFNEPEEIAEHLATPEAQLAGIKAFHETLTDSGVLKKKVVAPSDGSTRGLSPSSNSDAQPPTTGS